jgi:hypothetical protein
MDKRQVYFGIATEYLLIVIKRDKRDSCFKSRPGSKQVYPFVKVFCGFAFCQGMFNQEQT